MSGSANSCCAIFYLLQAQYSTKTKNTICVKSQKENHFDYPVVHIFEPVGVFLFIAKLHRNRLNNMY